MPDRELADQLGLVEAIALALGREVGQPIQTRSCFRSLPSLPLDRFDRPPGCPAAALPAVVSGFTVTVRP
jgi:hypothetical protein